MKRECSAVGKTQRALWSWLIRRSRWSQAVSRRSSSATSSSGRPAARGLGRRQALGQLDVAVDRVADEVDRGERVAASARPQPRSARAARRCVAATSSRSAAGARTSTSSPHGQDPEPDLDRARDRRPPAQRAVGLGRDALGRVPASPRGRGSRRAGAKRRTTSTGSWSAMMSQARPQPRRSIGRRVRRLERLAASARRPGSARS